MTLKLGIKFRSSWAKDSISNSIETGYSFIRRGAYSIYTGGNGFIEELRTGSVAIFLTGYSYNLELESMLIFVLF